MKWMQAGEASGGSGASRLLRKAPQHLPHRMERVVGASPKSPGLQHRASERSVAERADVRAWLRSLQHALRTIAQYGESSPAVTRAVDILRESFGAVWKTHPLLTLYFQDEEIWVDTGHVRAAAHLDSGRGPSPLQNFRNAGFHSITFLRGFEQEELLRFLEHASRAFPADGLEDLATALWFEDLRSFHFTLNDTLVDVDRIDLAGPSNVDATAGAIGAPDDPPPIPEALLTRPLTLQELQLSSQEANHLEELLAEEMRRPVCADVMSALMDSLQEDDGPLRVEILLHLDRLLPILLQSGYLHEIGTMLVELRSLAEAHQEMGQGFCTAIQRTLSLFERSSQVAEYLKDLEVGEIVPELEALARFTRGLGPANAKSLLRIAERTRGKPIAALFQDACAAAVSRDPDLLMDLLRSDDDVVLRGAMSLITSSPSEEAVREVIRLLRHRNSRMRLVAAKSLMNVRRHEALHALMCSLEDENEDVRQTCAWALSTWEYEPAFEAIRGILESSRMQDMVLSEKLTYFDAYARLGRQRAVPYLAELLNARHLFRPRYESDLRACAARGLGQIAGIESRQALESAVDDRDPKVKRTVMRQLRQLREAKK